MRWAGSYGVEADFIAKSHCSVEFIPINEILVSLVNGNHSQHEVLMNFHDIPTVTVNTCVWNVYTFPILCLVITVAEFKTLLMHWQKVLEKFEFLSIKSKVLRARENLARYTNDLNLQADFWGNRRIIKTKVGSALNLKSLPWRKAWYLFANI